MVLKFFTGVVIMLIIIWIITAIFEYEADWCNDHWYEGSKKYKSAINKIADIMNVILHIAIIIFSISNIAILIYGIEWENVKNYEYYIYIPKDSTYFTDKE